MLDKIKAEIAKEVEKHSDEWQYVAGLMTAKDIYEKYAGQEPSEDATLKDIFCMDCEYKQEQTGHWIRQDNTKEPLYGWYFCSECNSVIGEKTQFCSNCGARMIEAKESEDKE